MAKLGQKTIKNQQKQSILTQGGQKTIKIYQKTIIFYQNNNGAAFGGAPGALPRPGGCCFDKKPLFFSPNLIVFDPLVSELIVFGNF